MCSAHRLEHLLNFDKKSRCLIVITGIRLSFLQNKVLIHYTFIADIEYITRLLGLKKLAMEMNKLAAQISALQD